MAVSAGCSDTGYEADELRLPDPEVLFLRQEPVPAGRVEVLNAEGIGELVLDGPCLQLRGDATIVWPAGSALHVDDGVVEVRDRAGQVLAKVGDEIAGWGGYAKSEYEECPGLVFRIHEIMVLPDVDVYFLKQDGALEAGLNAKQFTGKLTLDGKCLAVDDAIREEDGSVVRGSPLLFWPQDYELNVQDGAVEVIDADGRVAARVGDEVQLSAINVSYGQAIEHGGLDVITPACSGPYWMVEEVSATAGAP